MCAWGRRFFVSRRHLHSVWTTVVTTELSDLSGLAVHRSLSFQFLNLQVWLNQVWMLGGHRFTQGYLGTPITPSFLDFFLGCGGDDSTHR